MNWLLWVPPVMGVVSAVLQVYMLLLVIRIVLTWVSMDHGHPVLRILHSVSDPYLNWFRRFRFLVIGQIDFSPLAALLVVNFLAILAGGISREGQFTVGIVLELVVKLIWGAAGFLLLLLGILSLIRFLGIRFRWGGPQLWSYLDALLQPPAYALGKILRPGTFLAYTTTLLILAAVNLAGWALGNVLVDLVAGLLHSLPV